VTQSSKFLVIGIGNEYRHDDAAGLVVARRIKERAPGGCEVYEHIGEGTALMQLWKYADRVLVIDAVRSSSPAATIHCVEASRHPLPAGVFRDSTHAFGLVEAIELSRTLKELPSSFVVYGIEGENFKAGIGLSPPVQNGINKLLEKVWQQVEMHSPARYGRTCE